MIPAYHAGYVVDASVGVKWFVREREADREVALAETMGFPCVMADEALIRKMKGHSIVLRLKDLAFE